MTRKNPIAKRKKRSCKKKRGLTDCVVRVARGYDSADVGGGIDDGQVLWRVAEKDEHRVPGFEPATRQSTADSTNHGLNFTESDCHIFGRIDLKKTFRDEKTGFHEFKTCSSRDNNVCTYTFYFFTMSQI